MSRFGSPAANPELVLVRDDGATPAEPADEAFHGAHLAPFCRRA